MISFMASDIIVILRNNQYLVVYAGNASEKTKENIRDN